MLTEGKQGRRGLNTFIHALASLPPSVFCSVQRWLFVNEMTPSGRLTEAEHGLCFFRDSKERATVDPWGENSTSYGTVSHPLPLLNVGLLSSSRAELLVRMTPKVVHQLQSPRKL